jgi:hypothetical protein
VVFSILLHPAVHGVLSPGIVVVEPGGEEAQPTLLAPVLVGNHVVGVVRVSK